MLKILVGKLIIYTIVCVCVCVCVCVYALTAVLQFHRGVALQLVGVAPQLVRVAKQRVHIPVSEQIIAVA